MLKERIDKLRLGSVMTPTQEGYISPVDIGAMITNERFEALRLLLKEAEELGASIHGGTEYHHPYLEHGAYFRPALVGGVRAEWDIAQNER